MSDKIRRISEQRSRKKANSIALAIRRAAQHIHNVGVYKFEEQEALASGDMKKFLENPDVNKKDD